MLSALLLTAVVADSAFSASTGHIHLTYCSQITGATSLHDIRLCSGLLYMLMTCYCMAATDLPRLDLLRRHACRRLLVVHLLFPGPRSQDVEGCRLDPSEATLRAFVDP